MGAEWRSVTILAKVLPRMCGDKPLRGARMASQTCAAIQEDVASREEVTFLY